jgi:hypothetical protein
MSDPIRRSIERLETIQLMLSRSPEGFNVNFSWNTINQVIRDLRTLIE